MGFCGLLFRDGAVCGPVILRYEADAEKIRGQICDA